MVASRIVVVVKIRITLAALGAINGVVADVVAVGIVFGIAIRAKGIFSLWCLVEFSF